MYLFFKLKICIVYLLYIYIVLKYLSYKIKYQNDTKYVNFKIISFKHLYLYKKNNKF